MSEALDLFGFGGRPPRGERRAAAPARPPAAVAPPPIVAAPSPVLALPSLPVPASRESRDIDDAADGAAVAVAAMLQGWTLTSAAYGADSTAMGIRWLIGSLRHGGWLRDAPEPGGASTPLLQVAPPVPCALEVYQLLAQMIAALQAEQLVPAPDQDPAALRGWLQSAERTLRQHRAVAVARREQHA